MQLTIPLQANSLSDYGLSIPPQNGEFYSRNRAISLRKAYRMTDLAENCIYLSTISADPHLSLQVFHGLPLFFLRCLRVDIHGRADIRMPHQFLDRFDVGFVLAEPCAECMAEGVGGKSTSSATMRITMVP